jgi:hypothetical protein
LQRLNRLLLGRSGAGLVVQPEVRQRVAYQVGSVAEAKVADFETTRRNCANCDKVKHIPGAAAIEPH